MLPDTQSRALSGIWKALERQLATRKFAAFFVEPVQSENGIRVPPADYLANRGSRSAGGYGALLVLDEVQTGMYRSGTFPGGAPLQGLETGHGGDGQSALRGPGAGGRGADVRRRFRLRLQLAEARLRPRLHVRRECSGHARGLATLDVLEHESLGERAATLGGPNCGENLSDALAPYEMVKSVRGVGMLSGIEFNRPDSFGCDWPLRLSNTFIRNVRAGAGDAVVPRPRHSDADLRQPVSWC
jgi:hypothetical protein